MDDQGILTVLNSPTIAYFQKITGQLVSMSGTFHDH